MTDFAIRNECMTEANKIPPIRRDLSPKTRKLNKTVSFSLKNEEFRFDVQEPVFIESNLEFIIQDREIAFSGKGNSSSCVSFENFDKSSQGTAMDTEFNNVLIQERVEPVVFSMDEVIYRLLALQAQKALEEDNIISDAMGFLEIAGPETVITGKDKS
jgi:hypothetical protein